MVGKHSSSNNTAGKYEDTLNWDHYWQRESANDNMVRGGKNMAKRLALFIERYSIHRIADFGCGPGITLFILAGKYPGLSFTGFDPSMPVIKLNRSRAEKLGLSNMRFECEMLPEIRTTEKYDLVYCIATLHYVKDIRGAIRNLYARVEDGGFLIFNYPNRFSLRAYKNQIGPDDREKQKRFSLILNEKNLLTLKDIVKALERRPVNFWKAVGERPSRENNCVYVRKICR